MRTPEAVAKLREARRLLRLGTPTRTVMEKLGLPGFDVTNQRRLLRVVKGHHRMMASDVNTGAGRGALQQNKASAAATGDLVDIFNARPSRKDWGAAEGRD